MKNLSAVKVLGAKIRQERKSQGLTQQRLASLAGVSLNFLSQLELGKSTARVDKILQVLQTLGLELHIQYGLKGVSV